MLAYAPNSPPSSPPTYWIPFSDLVSNALPHLLKLKDTTHLSGNSKTAAYRIKLETWKKTRRNSKLITRCTSASDIIAW